MTNNTMKCPVCNNDMNLGETMCPRCGYSIPGQTEKFEPVSVSVADEKAANEHGYKPVLQVVKGPYNGQEFVMGEGTFTIGRDPSCDFFLNNTTVSRHHADITVKGTEARIEDKGSLNGTWVNGTVVDASVLSNGTILQIGSFEMMFKLKLV